MTANRLLPSTVLVLALMLAGVAAAADNTAVVGKWGATMNFQGRSFDITLEILEADGALAGTWESPRGKDDLADVAWDGETLTFNRSLERGGQSFTLAYSAKVDGDTMEGTMSTPGGDRPFTATRQ